MSQSVDVPTVPTRRLDRAIVALFLLLAVTGSLLSVFLPEGCGGCERAKRAVGPLPLAGMGVAFYSSVLILSFWQAATPWVRRAIALAAGVHLALFGILLWRHTLCWICLGTGLCAISATIYLLARASLPWRTAAVFVLSGALAIGGPIAAFMRYNTQQDQRRALVAVQEAVGGLAPVSDGTVRLIVFTRHGCPRCEILKTRILPELLKSATPLELVERDATEDMSTPSVVAHGKQTYAAVGLHELADYQQLVRAARGQAAAPSRGGIAEIPPR